jgi:hypothetical protein
MADKKILRISDLTGILHGFQPVRQWQQPDFCGFAASRRHSPQTAGAMSGMIP